MTAEAQAPAADVPAGPDRATLLVYFGALIAMFMATMDMQIMVTALPTIAGELGGVHLFGWVGASYLLSTAAVAPFYGKLGDMYGRKNVVLTAIILFLVGSLVCGMAWSMESLDCRPRAAGHRRRRADGLGLCDDRRTVRAARPGEVPGLQLGRLHAVLGARPGGRRLHHRSLRLALGVPRQPADRDCRRGADRVRDARSGSHQGRTRSTTSAACSSRRRRPRSSTGATMCSIRRARTSGPMSCRSIGVAALIAFVMVERRAEEPIIPLRLFRNHTITVVSLVSLIAGICTLGLFFYFALYIQTITGLSPAIVGFLFLPASAASLVVSIGAGWVIAANRSLQVAARCGDGDRCRPHGDLHVRRCAHPAVGARAADGGVRRQHGSAVPGADGRDPGGGTAAGYRRGNRAHHPGADDRRLARSRDQWCGDDLGADRSKGQRWSRRRRPRCPKV